MKLFWLKTRFTWIASLSIPEDIHNAKIVKRVRPELRQLCSLLLSIGGERVVVPLGDAAFSHVFVELGEIIVCKRIRTRRGEERECHQNTAALWRHNKTRYRIGTGFGLSNDTVWRRHSWIVSTRGSLIETTLPRAVYFGVVLDDEGAARFAEAYA